MKYSKAIEIMIQLKAEYFYAFKDMPDELFKLKAKNFMTALEGYSDKEIDVALGFVLKENKTLPTTAHFIEVLEKNREMFLPSAEEEWVKISSVIGTIKSNRDLNDWDKRVKLNNQAYNSLSDDVKNYFVNKSGFLDLLEVKNIEIAKAQFIKAFPEWRRLQKKKTFLTGEFKDEDKLQDSN